MRSIWYRTIFGLLIIAGFTSCEPESTVPDQNKIYGVYYLDYNTTEDKTTARVSFFLEEPSSSNQQELELTYPANVTYNGENLVFESVERYYSKEFVGLIEENFVYSNYHNNQFTNTISMVDTISMVVSDSADTQNDYYFQVLGSPLDTNEVIDIYVESINSGVTLGSSFENLSGLSVQINSSQLTSLGIGPTIVRASRRANVTNGVQAPQVGGLIQTRWSVQDTVYIY